MTYMLIQAGYFNAGLSLGFFLLKLFTGRLLFRIELEIKLTPDKGTAIGYLLHDYKPMFALCNVMM